MTTPAPDPGHGAAEIYDDFLRRVDGGKLPDFESLCANHRDVEVELRALHRANEVLCSLLPGPLEHREGNLAPEPGVESHCDPAPPDELLQRMRAAGPRSDRYEVQGEIGRGGMGVVFRVWDKELRRTLAMKVLHREHGRDAVSANRALARFLEEAQVTGQLDHPGIVSVHDIGVDAAGQVFFTMHLVRGESLRTILGHVQDASREWTQVRALGVILKVCEAMSYAHNRGVIHRDLKPANVMAGEFGEVHVMDWGLARLLGRADTHALRLRGALPAETTLSTERNDHRANDPDSPLVTVDGESVGTPVYMAPEQARGEIERLGPPTDIYSVGAILYQLLSGELPFAGGLDDPTPRRVLARVIAGPPRPLRAFGRRIPAELTAICERAMARLPEQRYPDMHSLAEDLRAYLEDRVVRAHATGPWAETRKWIQRNPLAAASMLLTVALLVVGVVWAVAQLDANERDGVRQTLKEIDAFWEWSADRDAVVTPGAGAYAEWIERATGLVAELAYHQEQFVGPPAAALQDARAAYERARELEVLREEILWRERMFGLPWPPDSEVRAEVDEALQGLCFPEDIASLNQRVFTYVRPDVPRIPGHEAAALLLAQRLLEAARAGGPVHPRFLDTAAFAYFRRGLIDESLRLQRTAAAGPFWDLGGASAEAWQRDLEGNLRLLERMQRQWKDGTARHQRDRLAVEVESMELEIAASAWRRTGTDAGSLHEDRARLVAELLRLRYRLLLAKRAAPGGEAGAGWADAIEAIKRVSVYEGLVVSPQLGLVPLGPDPASGLWEFADLFSGERPVRTDKGLDIGPETGIVFVLLPGSSVPLETGASRQPFHDQSLRPFFLSKYEVTEHQAIRLGMHMREVAEFTVEARIHAAAGFSWDLCSRALARSGNWLALPSALEWEYGCRARTTTPWSTGSDPSALTTAAWILTGDAPAASGPKAPGLKAANAFGLHDMHGNVAEWCSDAKNAEPGKTWLGEFRLLMGGSYRLDADSARCDKRILYRPRARSYPEGGMRPARCLTR